VPRRYSMAKRAQAKERVRGQIERALIRVLATQPYDDTTMTDIARVASVSTRTVQRYFGSMDQVLAATVRYPAETLAEELRSRSAAETAKEGIGQLVEAMFGVYNRHRREMWAVYTRSQAVPELIRAQLVASAVWVSAIDNFLSRWPDVWTVDRQTAKRALLAFTSYPTWRGFTGSGGFGSPEAERFMTDVICRYMLREDRRIQKQQPS
jgi:AcrR family transcriptional regulator